MYYIPDTLAELFEFRPENEITLNAYLTAPKNIKSTESLYETDKRITQEIQDAERFIKLLKEYRQELFKRSQNISTATFFPVLNFWRKKNMITNKVYYHITISMRSSDSTIADKVTLSEDFPGTERRKAFSRFEDLKKQHPGILIEQQTEKERWER